MPALDLTDEELQGFVVLCATASGPGINWTLTNALLNKARLAQERSQANAEAAADLGAGNALAPKRLGNSEDHDPVIGPRHG